MSNDKIVRLDQFEVSVAVLSCYQQGAVGLLRDVVRVERCHCWDDSLGHLSFKVDLGNELLFVPEPNDNSVIRLTRLYEMNIKLEENKSGG